MCNKPMPRHIRLTNQVLLLVSNKKVILFAYCYIQRYIQVHVKTYTRTQESNIKYVSATQSGHSLITHILSQWTYNMKRTQDHRQMMTEWCFAAVLLLGFCLLLVINANVIYIFFSSYLFITDAVPVLSEEKPPDVTLSTSLIILSFILRTEDK